MSRTGRLWPLALVGVLGLTVVANGLLFWAANGDQRLAYEPDYYRKALAWDSTAAQAVRNTNLGWSVAGEFGVLREHEGLISVRLADRDGVPVNDATLSVEAVPIAHAGQASMVSLAPAGPGRYAGTVALVYHGLYELRVAASRDTIRFTATLRGSPGGALLP